MAEQQTVRIAHKDGRFATVPAENLAEAEKLGWREERAEDKAERQKGTVLEAAGQGAAVGLLDAVSAPAKLTTALGAAGARALGADVQDPLANVSGRSAYVGAAGLAAAATGGDERTAQQEAADSLRANEQVHGFATTAGEIVGGLPLLATGVGALEAAAARGAARLGLKAGAARIAGQVGGNAVVGAGMGATAASENAWIKDVPLTAEQSLASIGLGALFGGGASLATAGVAKAAPSIARALRRGGPEVSEGLEAAATRVEAEAAQPVVSAVKKAEPAAMETVPEGLFGKARKYFNDVGDETAVDAISRGNKPALRALGAGEAPSLAAKREAGALLHDMGIFSAGRSESDMWKIAQAQRSQNGSKMGAVMDTLDKDFGYANAEPTVRKIEGIAQKLETEGKFAGKPEGRQAAEFIRERLTDLEQKSANGIVTHSDMHSERMYWDTIGYERNTARHLQDAAREVRAVISEELKNEIKKASPELRREWDLANKRYGVAKWADETLAERVSVRSGANRLLSPSDYGTALATAVGTANPLLGLATGLGNKLIRERGYSTFSALTKRIAGNAVDVGSAPAASLGTARRLQTLLAHTTEQVDGHIGEFLERPTSAVARTMKQSATMAGLRAADLATAQAAYRDHAKEVQLVASNPDVAQDRLGRLTGQELQSVAPGLHTEMAQVAARGAAYLSQNLPAPATDPESITPHLDQPPPVSHSDLARYADRVEGVENPLSFLADLLEGKVSPEKRDAVKVVWPQVFEAMRQTVFAHLAEATTEVPYDKRKQLDLALDAKGALEPSMRPGSLKVMQAVFKSVSESRAQPRARGPVPQVSKMFETRSSRLAMR